MSFASEALPELAPRAGVSAVKSCKPDPGRILFTAETAGRRKTLLELLKQVDLNPVTFDTAVVDSNDLSEFRSHK